MILAAKLRPGSGAQGILPTPMKDGPHVRLGWARRESPLNAPVGFDGYSYGLRDVGGQRIFLSRASDYGEAFQPGDVVGMYIISYKNIFGSSESHTLESAE